MSTTVNKKLETELTEVRDKLKQVVTRLNQVEKNLKTQTQKQIKTSNSTGHLLDSVAELKENFNRFHESVQTRVQALYENINRRR